MTAPGGFVAGDVLGAADMNALPAGVVGYAQVTADQTGITAETDLTSLSVTFTAVAGRRYRLTAQVCADVTTGAPSPVTLLAKEGSTNLARDGKYLEDSGTVGDTSLRLIYENGSSISGSKTWKLALVPAAVGPRQNVTPLTKTIAMGASATFPAFIQVEDVGPI